MLKAAFVLFAAARAAAAVGWPRLAAICAGSAP